MISHTLEMELSQTDSTSICAKALGNSLLEQLPTELLLLILSFVLDNCTGTWYHVRLVSCQFFSLLDHSFVELFDQVHLEASEVSLGTWLEWPRPTPLRSYFHAFTFRHDVLNVTHDTGRLLLQNPNNAHVNLLLEELNQDDEVLMNTRAFAEEAQRRKAFEDSDSDILFNVIDTSKCISISKYHRGKRKPEVE